MGKTNDGIPKTGTVRVCLMPLRPRPNSNGSWTFGVHIDGYSRVPMQVTADTTEDARLALMRRIHRALDGKPNIEATYGG